MFVHHMKYTYEWSLDVHSLSSSSSSTSMAGIEKSPVMLTKNNIKWHLYVDLRQVYRKTNQSFTVRLLLDELPKSDDNQILDIEFNVYLVAKDDITGHTRQLVVLYTTRLSPPVMINSNRTDIDTKNIVVVVDKELPFNDQMTDDNHQLVLYFELVYIEPRDQICQRIGTDLVDSLRTLMSSGDHSDVTLVVGSGGDGGDRQYSAHKCILSARSEFFRAMFANPMKESNDNRVIIDTADADVFDQLLEFIYTGSIGSGGGADIDPIAANRLLVCAEYYSLPDLKSICEHILSQTLTTGSAIDLLLFAIKYNARSLREKLIDYVANNYLEIELKSGHKLSDLFKTEPQLMQSIVHKIAKLNNIY